METQKKNKQPLILPILVMAEGLQRFIYYGIQATLLLYLTHSLDYLNNKNIYLLVGSYTAFTFIVSILGGLAADRFFGANKLVLAGMSFSFLGVCLLAFTTNFFFGLSLVVCGVGLFAPNNPSLLGKFCDSQKLNRNRGFSILYIGTNLGGLLGPLIFGILFTYRYQYSFLLSAIMLGIWFSFYIKSHKLFMIENRSFTTFANIGFITFCISLFVAIFFMISYTKFIEIGLSFIGIISTAILFILFSQQNEDNKNKILYLCFLIFTALLFFIGTFQIYSSLLEYIQHHIDHRIFGLEIPVATFTCLQPLFVICFTPIIIYIWKRLEKIIPIQNLDKIILGMFFSSASFAIFSLSTYFTNKVYFSLACILLANALLAIAEICIMPPIVSSISYLSPHKLKSTMQGFLYLSLAFSGYFASKIAGIIDLSKNINSVEKYSDLYFYIALTMLAISFLLFYLTKVTRKSLFLKQFFNYI